jgi:3-dehydroquinate synthase
VDVQRAQAGGARSIRAGLAEAVKYGAIADAGLLGFLESRAGDLLGGDGLAELVAWCLRIKAGIVDEDEEGSGRRLLLNYGHTFAYAIEASTGFRRYTHGEAVAIGMTLAARVGTVMGITDRALEPRQTALLRRFGLPCDFSGVATAQLVEALWRDKKKQGPRLRFVLPVEPGRGEVRSDVPIDLVARVLNEHGPVGRPVPDAVDSRS